MKRYQQKIIVYRCLLLLGTCFTFGTAVRVKKVHHLEDHKFASEEYLDPEIDERDSGPEPPVQQPSRMINYNYSSNSKYPDKLDPNIKFESNWNPDRDVEFGQITAVSFDPNGNIGVFHRGDRVWGSSTFNIDNRFNPNEKAIRQNTILLLDRNGKVLLEWGKNIFFLPHGLTIDFEGNYWITDVAMHQVFKFNAIDIEAHKQQLLRQRYSQRAIVPIEEPVDVNNLFANSLIKPAITLGEPFQPGNDQSRFCKPTAVAVSFNGDFFVSDGYCNSRIIKYNKEGERILEWGRSWERFSDISPYIKAPPPNAFLVPHALALAEEYDYLYVADRENGRIECFFASNGTFHKEYQNQIMGGPIYSIAYAKNRLYVVNGQQPQADHPAHVRGYVLDVETGNVLSQFAPNTDMNMPHDIAVSSDGKEIYVAELNIRRLYKFTQDISKLKSRVIADNSTGAHAAQLSDNPWDSKKQKSGPALATFVIFTALIMIGLCIVMAAAVARYQKRGCLFTSHRRRKDWNDDRSDSFKFSQLLEPRKKFKIFEKRPNTKDFSKVNTEPETSDDESPEISLEKIV